MEGGLIVSIAGRTGIIELARPARRNALLPQDRPAIRAALQDFAGEGGLRAVLIRAQGADFCTGIDLDAFASLRRDKAALAAFIAEGHAVLTALAACPLPVVAAVQGLCLAGGLELALGCDIILAGQGARLGDQHAKFGLVPAWGGSQMLPRRLGLPRALDLLLTGRWISAPEAAAWGLVSRVLPDDALQAEATALCDVLAGHSREGLAAMKLLVRRSLDAPLAEGLREEAATARTVLAGADATEGLAAFAARRRPVFD